MKAVRRYSIWTIDLIKGIKTAGALILFLSSSLLSEQLTWLKGLRPAASLSDTMSTVCIWTIDLIKGIKTPVPLLEPPEQYFIWTIDLIKGIKTLSNIPKMGY